MLKGGQFEEIGETARSAFVCLRVLTRLELDRSILMIPLQSYLPTRKVDPASNILPRDDHAFFDNDLFMTTKMFLQAGAPLACASRRRWTRKRRICMAARGQTVRTRYQNLSSYHPCSTSSL
jgi:hypothetical protein